MRHTASRRQPEKPAATATGDASPQTAARQTVTAGAPLDLGITVTVYCTGSAAARKAANRAVDAGQGVTNADTCYTEH